jgi:hypothetical protein
MKPTRKISPAALEKMRLAQQEAAIYRAKFPPRTTPLTAAELAGLEIPEFLKRAA